MNKLASLLHDPGKAERRAFAALTSDDAARVPHRRNFVDQSVPVQFTTGELVLIRESLRIAEGALIGRSANITNMIENGSPGIPRANTIANDLYMKSLDCGALADKITASMRSARR